MTLASQPLIGNTDGVRDQIAGQDPGRFILAGGQAAGDMA